MKGEPFAKEWTRRWDIHVDPSRLGDVGFRAKIRIAEIFQSVLKLADLIVGDRSEEVEHLLKIVAIKHLCRVALVEKIEAGPKGATISFRNNTYPNPIGLVQLITEHAGSMRVRPD